MSIRVLVTDADQRAALAITRSLGRAPGYTVIVAGPAGALAGASRHCDAAAVVPAAADDPEGFEAAIRKLGSARKADLVIPVTEASLLAILPKREWYRPAVIPFPDLAVFSRAADKGAVLALGRELGIAVPEAIRLASPAAAAGEALSALRFPVVLKPERSVRPASGGTLAKLGVVHAASPAELDRALAALPAEAFPLQIQQRIVGPGTGLFFLRWDGRILARFAHRRLREKPPAGGVSVYSESIPVDEELARHAEALLAALEWRGVAMVELKRDAATGVPYLMEINGRFWGSLQLAIDAGVNFPLLLAQAALGEPMGPPPSYRTGVRCRWWWGEVDHLLTRLRRSPEELHLPPGMPGLATTAARILIPGLSRGRNEVFRWNDPGPAWRETVSWFRSLR